MFEIGKAGTLLEGLVMPALKPPDTTITQTAQRSPRTNMNLVITSVNARVFREERDNDRRSN